MKDLLKRLKKKYNLKVGNIEFSPIMQCSIGLTMNYNEQVMNGVNVPFHLNFPDKENAALWLSIALLRNYLLEDYINQPDDRIEDLEIEVGDQVEIFGAVAIYKGTRRGKVLLGFSDQKYPIEINKKIIRYINPTDRTQTNKYRVFGRNKKEARINRNVISKLLEPNEPVLINDQILNSKVLIIAGRGNTGEFTNRLKEEYLFETRLSDVFNIGENIIIKPDLEDFRFIANPNDDAKAQYFESNFLRFQDELIKAVPDKTDKIRDLIEKVKSSSYRNQEFLKKYREIINKTDNKKLKKIFDFFPGVIEKLPENLKSVIINDITLLEHYEGVVDEFLSRKIPVKVISNRFINDKSAIYFFDEYFIQNQSDIRINWNKSKINELKKINTTGKDFLDSKLWEKCLKFSNQTISIQTREYNSVDSLLIELQRNMSTLEGQERLKKAYWQVFNPLIYSFKNGSGWKSYHEVLINKFLHVFNEIKCTLNSATKQLFEEIIESILKNRNNNKNIESLDNLFLQTFELDNEVISFPETQEDVITFSSINSDIEKITFPGFPLNEPLNKPLINSISQSLVESIKLICWPKEASITHSYILRRLKAGYFLDNIPNEWQVDKNILINSENDINKEIDSTLFIDLKKENSTEISIQVEEALHNISVFKYSAYKGDSAGNFNSSVVCNIIDLEGGAFMFLPKTSKIWAKVEIQNNEFSFKKTSFKELNVGDEVFQYELPRRKLRKISKSLKVSDRIFNDLEIWKTSLQESFERCSQDIRELQNFLKKIDEKYNTGGNPSYQNLRNWLYDDMLSPEEENLRLILRADPNENKIDELPKILKAYREANSLSRKVSSKIKKSIIKKLNEYGPSDKKVFEVKVFGEDIKVEFRKIVALQNADIEVEYQNTRKII